MIQSVTPVRPSFLEIGLKFQRFVIAGNDFIEPFQLPQRQRTVVPCPVIVGLKFNRPVIAKDRFLMTL